MVKRILVFFLVCGALAATALLFVTRNAPVSHPTLLAAELPPLIPTRAFYADPRAAFDYIASSDASYVAHQQASLTGRSIVVKEMTSGKQIGMFPVGLHFIRWHPTEPRLRFIFEGQDWEADPYNSERENWTRISPVRLSGGWYKNQVATDDEMPVLTWGKSSNRSNAHMWLVSQDGLSAEQIAEGNLNTIWWVFDEKTKPTLRLDSLDPATARLFRNTPEGWQKLIDIDLDDIFEPQTNMADDGTVIVRSSRGRDKAAMVYFESTTGEETVLLENPNGDIGSATSLSYRSFPDVVRLGINTQERVAMTERGQTFHDILAEFPQPVSLGITHPTASGRYVTQAISPQNKSWIYLLIDLEEKLYITLGEYSFRRYQDHLVQDRAVTFTARDGLEIPAVLHMPGNVTGPTPFVVEIHGGPAHAVSPGYSHDTQFLVNRGYGVLSVNFRGSTGFGKTFQEKGFKQFGRTMQTDIADGAHWLISEGLADPNALSVMGTNYGGYAAALALTRDPDLFKAAIVEFPMLDVEFQSRYHPGFWENGLHGWWRYFGKIDTPEDLDLMHQYSPSQRVEDLHCPVLLIGGLRDQITAVQQVKDFETAALAAGKDVRAHYFPNAGHGVNHWRDHLRRARLIEDFLAEQLGGRSGGFELAERAPAFID